LVVYVACVLGLRSVCAIEVLEEIVEQKYDLAPDATLSIANTDGSIRVYAGSVSQISIQAIKKAYTQERLKGIVVDVKATPDSVAINTTFPPRRNAVSDRSGTVEYTIIVPQTIRITKLDLANGEALVEGLRGGSAKARVSNGWLAGHNCFGDLDLAVTNGRLDLGYDWWEPRKFSVRASSTNASIRAFLPSDAAARIAAQTGTGQIVNAFGDKKSRPANPVRSLDFVTASEPDAAFEIRATSGNIRIEKTY